MRKIEAWTPLPSTISTSCIKCCYHLSKLVVTLQCLWKHSPINEGAGWNFTNLIFCFHLSRESHGGNQEYHPASPCPSRSQSRPVELVLCWAYFFTITLTALLLSRHRIKIDETLSWFKNIFLKSLIINLIPRVSHLTAPWGELRRVSLLAPPGGDNTRDPGNEVDGEGKNHLAYQNPTMTQYRSKA